MSSISDGSKSALRLFFLTLAGVILGLMIYFLALAVVTTSGAIDPTDLAAVAESAGSRQTFRLLALLSNLLPFAGAALLALLIVYRRRWRTAAGLDVGPQPHSVFWSVAFFVVSLPLVGYLAYHNLQMDLPDWAQASEESTDAVLRAVLQMDSVGEFLLAFLTVAVTPAVGEELLMRGVLQRRVFRAWFGNPHAAIWIAAALFSFVHFEFGGFAPRMLLGVLLGYAYYWSRSLWVPIGLHLAFNGLQVVSAYVSGEFDPAATEADEVAWYLAAVSLLLTIVVGWQAETRFGHLTDDSLPHPTVAHGDVLDDTIIEEDPDNW